jgi:uncharacterized RDD family membrane protein YckC
MSTMTNRYAPPRAAVSDVEIAASGIVLADRGARLGASILDSFFFMLFVYLPFFLGVFVIGANGDPEDPSAMLGGFVIALVGFVIWCWINFRSMARNGQSMAKKMVGIKVVRSDGSPASLGRLIWLRNVLNGLIAIIPAYGIIDSLFIFAESRQCLHDKIADTIVIKA